MVLDQFRKDIVGVTNLYTNSQNAGFYYGNYSKGFRLLSFDYNEPCCDLWERISETVKVLQLRALSEVS